jgi:hypothetical protein
MIALKNSQILRTIPFLIATCHCERSAAIRFRVCVATAVFLLAIVSTATAKYSGGSGTAQDPYQIATAADLILLGDSPEDYGKHFVLTADIDLDPNLPGRKVFDRAVIAPDTDAAKADFQGVPFSGVFDGNGHIIAKFSCVAKKQDYIGLFAYVSQNAQIKNVGLTGLQIQADWQDCVGTLVAYNEGAVTDCRVEGGSVKGWDWVGGLVGSNGSAGTVASSYSTATVTGDDHVGGLVGENRGGVAYSYSIGRVTGRMYVGGLVGDNGGIVTQSYSTGAVVSTSMYVGGLVGYHYSGHITCCYSTGVVSGGDSVGGLVGRNCELNFIGQRTGAGYVTFCYSTGAVRGNTNVGGLAGAGYRGVVTACFWDIQTSGQTTSAAGTGETTAEMQTAGTFFDWGICGNPPVWTIDDGTDYPRLRWENKPGKLIEPRLSDFLKGAGTPDSPYLIYTLVDLDVIAKFPCEQDKHFRLAFLAGEGTQENPYLIDATSELNLIGMLQKEWDKHYKLMADIDLSAFDGKDGRPTFKVIGSQATPFTGIFDGDGHAISHLTITGESYLGLFGQLASRAEVRDLGVVDVNISGSYYVGGLVGRNDGTLIRCYSAGEINGTHYVGGLAGHNSGTMAECTSTGTAGGTGDCVGGLAGRNTGTVTQCCCSRAVSSSGVNGYVGGLVGLNDDGVMTGCYSTGPVRGNQFVGGLVGYNSRGTVTHCYSTGPVSGNDFIGGAVGYNDRGSVTQCYSIGAVRGERYIGGLVGTTYFGIASNSFWDMQSSGQAVSAAGTGKTTAEMQTAKTFLDAGWDFVGETANGTADIWWILEGKDYPRLWWEAAKK